ncbi:MAG TPA: hypothetical protein VGR57_17670 [Ktedonobacterales bacterium]|nr:hypothetical protein [Ktedonobacterales bacterium]
MATTQMAPIPTAASARPRRYSTLDIVALVALGLCLLGDLPFDVRDLLTGGAIPPPVVVIDILWAVAVVVVATGWRWAVIPALIISLLTLALYVGPGFPLYTITHPGDSSGLFFAIMPKPPLLAIATLASGTKVVRLVRRQPVSAPRWFTPATTALIGFAIGALLIGAFAGPSAGGAGSAQAGTETVHLGGASFIPNIVAVHKGDMLALVGDSPAPHIIANGSWNSDNNKTLPGTEPGAPVVNSVTVNNTTVKTGPWTTPGTYHLYCSVHPGMNLTVIVQ